MRILIDAVDSLRRDLVAATRGLSFRPGYVVVATLTLALGISSSTVVFSVIDAAAFQPIPYAAPERLVQLWERSLQDPEIDRWPVSPATYRDWRAMMRSYEDLAAYDYRSAVFTDEQSAQRVRGLLVEGNLFALLGARPLAGRVLVPEDVDGDGRVVVISHGLWTRAFGQDESVVGRDIVLDGEPTTVVGIMPAGFRLPYDELVDIWRPLRLTPEAANERGRPTLFVLGRLLAGADLESAREEADLIAAALAERYPEAQEHRGTNLLTLRANALEWRLPMLQIFALAVGLMLAVACVNFAGLMLSRGLARSGELGVRMALGAGRRSILQVLLIEALVVAGLGAIAGAALAVVLLPVFIQLAPEGWSGPLMGSASIDGRALAFSVVLAVVTAVVASIAPALRVPRLRLADVMQGGARTAGSRDQLRLRHGLVVVQVMLALVLLGEAGRLTRSVVQTFAFDVGFATDGVLSARVPLSGELTESTALFYRDLAERAAALPGVEQVSLANVVPLSGNGMLVGVTTDGSAPSAALSAEDYNLEVQFRMVDARFFDLLRIPLIAGRGVRDDDVAAGERVAVVNEKFARSFFDGESAIGASFRAALHFQESPEGFDRPWRIVGIAGDVAEWGIWSQPPIVYVPYGQEEPTGSMSLMLRTAVPPESLIDELESTVWELGNRMPMEEVKAIERFKSDRLYAMHGFILSMFGFFAGAAVLLAAVGVYGVIAFQVRQRRREISVRIALGARTRDVLSSVLREGLVMSLLGAAFGFLLTLATGRLLTDSFLGRFLFEVGWFDPLTFGGAALLMIATVALASLAPARRAARVDPAGALKGDH